MAKEEDDDKLPDKDIAKGFYAKYEPKEILGRLVFIQCISVYYGSNKKGTFIFFFKSISYFILFSRNNLIISDSSDMFKQIIKKNNLQMSIC